MSNYKKIIVIGHKNPDTDSVSAAYAYAELKRALGGDNVQAAAAGQPTARTELLFQHFNIPLPLVVKDVFPCVGDLMQTSPRVVNPEDTILEALWALNQTHHRRIPVADSGMIYLGMASLFDIADRMVSNLESASSSLVGRQVDASIRQAAESLRAEIIHANSPDILQEMEVYVGAMSVENLRCRLLPRRPEKIVLVVGDREKIQELAVDLGIRLLILTGDCLPPSHLLERARATGVSIIRTPYDSATTVRRIKFCTPIKEMLQRNVETLSSESRICDIREMLKETHEGTFPVVEAGGGRLVGIFNREDLDLDSPTALVLVDHNELSQSVDGAHEVPIIEIIDHHRVSPHPTRNPILFINDIVGATCTLVAELYRSWGVEPSPSTAGILLGGIITDTLLLRSPTTTPRDVAALEWLAKVCCTEPARLAEKLFATGSAIAAAPAILAITADRKNYSTSKCRFAIAQIEEIGFDNFHKRRQELAEEMGKLVIAEGIDMMLLLVTDLVSNSSLLLCQGRAKWVDSLQFRKIQPGLYDLPGVVSRKKQLLPILFKTLS